MHFDTDQFIFAFGRNHHSVGQNHHPVASGQIEASILAARLNNNILTSTRLYSTRSQDQLPLGDVRKLASTLGGSSSVNNRASNGAASARGGSNGNVDLLVDFGPPSGFSGSTSGIVGNGGGTGCLRPTFESETLLANGGGLKRPGARGGGGQSRSSDNILDNAK